MTSPESHGSSHACPTCGTSCVVATSGEGTSYFIPEVGVLISEAQGMCTDERPYEEINVILDVAQRVLDGGYAKDAQAPGADLQDRHNA